jgi:serine O-acetyltransferase
MKSGFIKKLYDSYLEEKKISDSNHIHEFACNLLEVLFPVFNENEFDSLEEFDCRFMNIKSKLRNLLISFRDPVNLNPEYISDAFFLELEEIHNKIESDIQAILEGDPAAMSRQEVIQTYPGFFAISMYRIAHELHRLGVPLIPRVITEYAHSKTGIDIHPGARIGYHFCIDHGTGIVIGETTVIGNNVKIYQGVTLGALSVDKSKVSQKRHPTIEDNVVIYSNATILGGHTCVGKNSIIGGNVWLTKSVPPFSKAYHTPQITIENLARLVQTE